MGCEPSCPPRSTGTARGDHVEHSHRDCAGTCCPQPSCACAGVTHIVLDEVHERNLDSDLLLLLLRRALVLSRLRSSSSSATSNCQPPKVLLMSATADAQLFGDYFRLAGQEALLDNSSSSGPSHTLAGLDVSLLSIPGFTHPVRQLWLEDALQHTGLVIGKQSR